MTSKDRRALTSRENGKKGGRPRGSKSQETLTKEAAREVLRQMVFARLKPMVEAQLTNAIGVGHLYTRDKAGKFTKIEDEARVDDLLANGREGSDYWIFTKDPSVQAFADLLNRALDKPAEHVEMTVSKAQESSDEQLLERLAQLTSKLRKG